MAAGTDVLLTTQYLNEADHLADRIAIIDRGKVIAEGTPDELKSMAGDDVIQDHVAHLADVDRAIEVLAPMGTGEPRVDRPTRSVAVPVDKGSARLVGGRVVADTILATIGLTVTTLVGFAMGFRTSAPLGSLLLAVPLCVFAAFAFTRSSTPPGRTLSVTTPSGSWVTAPATSHPQRRCVLFIVVFAPLAARRYKRG